MEDLQSMNFGLPSHDTPQVNLGTERYRALSKLGQGGMATVWQMKDTQLLRSVALKQLHKEKSESNYEQENFVVEAQITAQLQHPGIVPIHDIQQDDDGNIYFTMREIQGQTLEDIIQTVHRVSDRRWNTTHSGWNLRRLIDAMENICQTVAYAHMRGVIHQDLKPANIMVGEYGEILVVDWGVARLRSLYQSNHNWVQIKASKAYIENKKVMISGTPRYMAPEQIHGAAEKIDGKADIFALGVILFYILTQSKPFLGQMPDILKHKKTRSASIREWLSNNPTALPIPTELIDICERAMQFNPADRFKDAKEMQQAIQSWLDGARQEEEARQILREIDALQRQIDVVELECLNLTPSLNQPRIDETELSIEWWQTWCALQEKRQQMDSIRDGIYQKAQGAILYAPHLPEIYNRLIRLEYQDYLDAVLEGNHKSISKTERRLNAYLDRLSPHEQERWENIRSVDLASVQSQKSHGVNIERRSEKQHVIDALQEHSWVSIVGLAGVGKTHLAWQVSTQWCKERSWDIVFCDATDCQTPATLLQRLTQALGVQQTGSDPFDLTIAILNRNHPKHTRSSDSSVLIIDNAESLNPDSVNLLGTILDRCPNIRLLTTTRKGFEHPLEKSFVLHPMSVLNGIELFSQHCKQQLPSWSLTESNRHSVLTIVNTLDRIPLAIELAGARIAEFSLVEIVTRLEERFALLRSNSSEQPTLQMALSWSCTSLSDLEKQVLYQLSVVPAAFTLTLAESIVDLPGGHSLSDVLDVLTQHSLINREYRSGITTYTMLKSIRDYAATQAEPLLIQATHHRMADHLARTLSTDPSQSVDLNLLTVASIHGAPSDASTCCTRLLKNLKQCGPFITGLEVAELFLARTDLDARHTQPIQLLYIELLQETGRSEDALAELIAIRKVQPTLKTDSDDGPIESIPSPFKSICSTNPSTSLNALQAQYDLHIQRHEWLDALNQAQQQYIRLDVAEQFVLLTRCMKDLSSGGQLRHALGIAEHLEELYLAHQHDRLSLLIDIAVLHTRLGNRETAIERYHLALDLAEVSDLKESQARIIGNLGLLYQADGNLEQALRQYKRAHSIFALLDKPDKLSALDGNLGTIHHEQGNIEQAITHFDQAITMAIQCENPVNHGVFLGNRAMCAIDLNNFDRAREDLEQAIAICDRHLEFAAGAFRGELAMVLIKMGSPELALQALEKGEAQVREHKEQYGKFLCRKASVLYAVHDLGGTKTTLRQAEQLCLELNLRSTSSLQQLLHRTQTEIPASVWLSENEIEERSFIANVAFQWARYETTSTRYPQALHHLDKALQLFDMLGNVEQVLETRFLRATIFSHTGKLKDAITIATEIRQQHHISGNQVAYGTVTNFLGGCHRRLGEIHKALQFHEESLQILQACNHVKQISALEKAGLCCRILGDYEQSLSYLKQALDMALSNNIRTGTLYCNVGLCHNVMGEDEKALEYYHLGIQELRKIGDRNRESLYLGNIANIYAQQERFEEAANLYRDVIAIALETGVQSNECISRGNFGDLLMRMGKLELADSELQQAIALGVDIYPIAANVFQSSLAKLRSLQGKHSEALELLSDINQDLLRTDVEEFTKFLCISSEIHLDADQFDQARALFEEATQFVQEQQFSEKTDAHIKWSALKQTFDALPTQ